MHPTVSSTVLYKLSEADAEQVNGNRLAAAEMSKGRKRYPASPPFAGRSAYILHEGNHVTEGDEFPAIVVRVFSETTVNLAVQLDGTDTRWATSRTEGSAPGQWSWPPKAGDTAHAPVFPDRLSAQGSDFSVALAVLKAGGQVARHGWNGTGMFVAYQAGYPDGIGINANTATATGIPQGTVCAFRPYLMLKTAEDEFVPWVASQTDLLADDWFQV